ncbi:MAG: NifU family protein [Rhodospirillaceae bacterium]|jgi:Fe-S cluster biogenesis protein NfuA|nr:NifU family protein [Rhodospirillaceae bacterium]
MFIQTEPTPNPETLKFLPGLAVLPSGTFDYRSLSEAGASPLAQSLFAIDGVSGVFLGHDFISVSKGAVEWFHLKPLILGAIMEHFTQGLPVIVEALLPSRAETGDEAGAPLDGADGDVVAQITELLETRVRPVVAQDGGDIVFHRFEEGIVFLHMRGACAGCPSSTLTLKNGIERMLQHFVPEVTEVRAI